jgi:hypothetical protein
MEEKHDDEDRDGPLPGHFDCISKPAADHVSGRNDERHKHSFTHSPVNGHLTVATKPGKFSFQIPGIELPGIFFASHIPTTTLLTNPIDGIRSDVETLIEQFHDSESEDIYDLYNACDGAVRDGFLDIRKLDELSTEELDVLNLERLWEIWRHTTSGCPTCLGIVSTLNSVRGALSDDDQFDLGGQVCSVEEKPH